jgi:FkbH-like protein
VRYSEDEVDKLSFSDEHITFAFSLEDKFGDNGLICVVVLFMEDEEILFIENWFMSCRVLKRGMENFVLNTIAAISRKQGFTTLKGEYQPTLKNVLVKDHYPDLGFEKKGVYWELSLSKYLQKGSVIKLRINDKGSYYKSGAEYFC